MADLHVAAVIVTYKCAQLTINCLASIEAERATPGLRIRVIVVDNASGDFDSISRAAEANHWSSWVTLIRAPKNGGFAYGNNLGIERAYQEEIPAYFYLLNPDTEVRPGAIGSLVRFMETHPDVGITGSGIDNPDGSEWPIAFRFPSLLSEISGGLETGLVSRLLRQWEVPQRMANRSQPIDWVSGASMMIRPALFEAIGGLDENYFLYFEETDLCFRARRAGFSTWYVPESRVMHIEGQSTRVNERTVQPTRRPAYWFESRRRYFAVNLGLARAIAVDIVAVLAYSLGWLKRLALRRMYGATPYFIRDLIRHSVLWRNNRHFPPVRSFRPRN
jgi:N-acetylglucosaminyl-diphospho-decaprenol L-rhamnosyltransferase